MTEHLIRYIEVAAQLAPVWGYVIIFILMAIESSFLPLPSEVVMIPAGFLAARGALTFHHPELDSVISILAGTLGSVVGAFVNYYLAQWLGRPFLYRYGRYFFLKPAHLMRAEELFREYGGGITFVCRMLLGIRHVISIPAGLSRMNKGTFALATASGAAIWVAILTGIGYYFGMKTADMTYAELVHRGKDVLNQNLHWIVLGCVVFFALYLYAHKLIMHSSGRRDIACEPVADEVSPE
jgi:membrane protein DedA with SNARE-associated domain